MTKTILKEAFDKAQKENEEKKINKFKEVILKTLEKLDEKQKQHRELIREIQILKQDIKDFAQGRLDRIEERQKKDEKAKEVSVVRIEKLVIPESITLNPFYQPYVWYWSGTTLPEKTNLHTTYLINGSFTHNTTNGTYVLSSGITKYLSL